MLHTTRAVVLRTVKHGDNSIVLKAYTEAFGARSYMVRTTKRARAGQARLQPLDRLELVVTEAKDREMHAVRECRVEKPYTGIPKEQARGLLMLFAQEVFYRTLKEESPDAAMFAFVLQTLEDIDTGGNVSHLPLLLLMRLARHMGFLPEPPLPGEDRFDMLEGCFFRGKEQHGHCMSVEASAAFGRLLTAEASGTEVCLAHGIRKELLDQLLQFFRLQVEGFGQLRSPEVLHAVLS